jgi:UDP-N-acetyl-D-galactosamine dehydrogenase
MGLTFKENCPDIRNTRVIDIVHYMNDRNLVVSVYDPWADPDQVRSEYGLSLIPEPAKNEYDGIILAVKHIQFLEMDVNAIKAYGKDKSVIYDIKSILPRAAVDARL